MLIATENGFQAIRQAVEERPDFRDFGLSTPVGLHFARYTSGARPDCAKQIIGAKREILDCALLLRLQDTNRALVASLSSVLTLDRFKY